jgi:hypothetical protein
LLLGTFNMICYLHGNILIRGKPRLMFR